jgi:hypothetical protein
MTEIFLYRHFFGFAVGLGGGAEKGHQLVLSSCDSKGFEPHSLRIAQTIQRRQPRGSSDIPN